MRSIFFKNPDPDPASTVFLCGSGRSGTTWLADLINNSNDLRYLFEPFWRVKVPAVRHFNVRQYLRPSNTDAAYLEPAKAIITGQIRRRWIDKYNRCYRGHKRLIKDTRVNLLVAWLQAHFPKTKFVFVMRHPAAVTLSRMKRKWRARTDEVLKQSDLVRDHLERPLARVGEPKDRFDRHVFMWCIENLVPLRQLAPGSVHFVYYEHLCTDPEPTLRALAKSIGHEFTTKALASVGKPSRQAVHDSAIRRGEDLTARWQSVLPPAKIDRVMEIVAGFGLDKIYTDDAMPIASDPLALFDASADSRGSGYY